jgi:hypothetical protein
MGNLEVSAMIAAKCFIIEVSVMPEAVCVGRVQPSLWVIALCGLEGPDISDEEIVLRVSQARNQQKQTTS